MEEVRKVILDCFKDKDFIETVQSVIAPIVKTAVSEAVAEKEREIESLRSELRETQQIVNDLEQYSRRYCLDISGVPESTGEETDSLVMEVARAAGVTISRDDIEVSHRVGKPRPGKTRKIILRCGTFRKRQELFQARKVLRSDAACEVFISENLTRHNSEIMYQARKLRHEKTIAAAWTDNGRPKIRVTENGPTKVIRSLEDLPAAPTRQEASPDAAPAEPPTAGGTGPPRRGRSRGGAFRH